MDLAERRRRDRGQRADLVVAKGARDMTKFMFYVLAAVLIIAVGDLARGQILFGGEDMLALAVLTAGAVQEVRHVIGG